jgi:uncharacterized protein YdeI (YjbR/CyaY-like superfamily)
MSRDKRIDAYIAKSQPFARPILTHLRELIHRTCPDVEETLKWGAPAFDYLDDVFCQMAAFKAHCLFGFWKTKLLDDPKGNLTKGGMGGLGKITSLDDLPSDRVIVAFMKQAMKLNEQGIKMNAAPKKEIVVPPTPPDMQAALKKNKAAKTRFDGFPPGAKRDYIAWLEEAKTDATRLKRLDTAIEWIGEGKHRHWKYQTKK